jgi:hypothetical protein
MSGVWKRLPSNDLSKSSILEVPWMSAWKLPEIHTPYCLCHISAKHLLLLRRYCWVLHPPASRRPSGVCRP